MSNLSKSLQVLKTFLTFSGGSLIGAALDYAITLFAYSALRTPPSLALALAMSVSASVVFLYHERVTFRTAGPGRARRYLRFMLLAVLVLALRVAVLEALDAAGLPVPLAVAVAIVLVSIFNFAASSMLVFMKGSK